MYIRDYSTRFALVWLPVKKQYSFAYCKTGKFWVRCNWTLKFWVIQFWLWLRIGDLRLRHFGGCRSNSGFLTFRWFMVSSDLHPGMPCMNVTVRSDFVWGSFICIKLLPYFPSVLLSSMNLCNPPVIFSYWSKYKGEGFANKICLTLF